MKIAYIKQTSQQLAGSAVRKSWEVGNVIGGVYGSYTALKLAIPSDLTFPATVKSYGKGIS